MMPQGSALVPACCCLSLVSLAALLGGSVPDHWLHASLTTNTSDTSHRNVYMGVYSLCVDGECVVLSATTYSLPIPGWLVGMQVLLGGSVVCQVMTHVACLITLCRQPSLCRLQLANISASTAGLLQVMTVVVFLAAHRFDYTAEIHNIKTYKMSLGWAFYVTSGGLLPLLALLILLKQCIDQTVYPGRSHWATAGLVAERVSGLEPTTGSPSCLRQLRKTESFGNLSL